MAKALIDRLQESIPGISATRALIAANLLVFVAMLFSGASLWHSPNGMQLAWGANFGPATQGGEWWRLASAMFLHFGALHLGLNVWALWDAGRWVERMYGPAHFLTLYFLAGLAGNFASIVFHPEDVVSAGASGAIFGLYGALLAYLWLRRRTLNAREFRWMFGFALIFCALIIAIGHVIPGIDNAAHLGGFVSGILLGIVLQPGVGGRVGRVLAICGIAMALAILVASMPQPSYRWHDELRARDGIDQFVNEDSTIADDWNRLLAAGERDRLSFDELARRIERDVSARYQHSFEELSALPDDPALPSAGTVERLRGYAERRRDASRELAEGLRERNPQKIGEALREAQGKRAE